MIFDSMGYSPFLHKNYLSNHDAYSNCERFWHNLFEEIVSGNDQTGKWIPFGKSGIAFGDGTYLDPVEAQSEVRGTGPILRMVAPSISKGVAINQTDASGLKEAPDYPKKGWIDVMLDDTPWSIPEVKKDIDMMRIVTLLTEDRLPLIKLFIHKWIAPETTRENMREFLNDLHDKLH
jgi:hypothetical protein